MSFVYKFINIQNEVIYVGRTENLHKRMTYQHFTEQGHLPKRCYQECKRVEYAKVKSLNESRIYELYLISKYLPKYNSVFSEGGELTFELPQLEWIGWNINQSNLVIVDVESFNNEIEEAVRSILQGIETMEICELEKYVDAKSKKQYQANLNWIKRKALLIESIKNQYLNKQPHGAGLVS